MDLSASGSDLPHDMKALTFQGEKQIALSTVPTPHLVHASDVIIKVLLCGICGRCFRNS